VGFKIMQKNIDKFIWKNSPCGGFLQSEQWKIFQESVGIKTYNISGENFWSNILVYCLPIVGKYFYIPRGPVVEISNFKFQNSNDEIFKQMQLIVDLAKKEKVGWIRIDNKIDNLENLIKENDFSLVKSPHDMQPKQLFIMDITKSEEDLLAQMKPKTRYNIRLAIKKGVQIEIIENLNDKNKIEKFLNLIEKTESRKGVSFHPREYYRKMLKNISSSNLKLYIAVYKKRIVAGALLVIYGKVATYLHGASDGRDKNVMAPFLLQWQMIKEAKQVGCESYDFGGVSMGNSDSEIEKKWKGITTFKQGFSKSLQPLEFSGSYDIIVNPVKYWAYRIIQKLKTVL
jgi:lipid II:glycine glycyltransferase (peptidoglycan interpeptide bridge formation enzyme)